jgi:hypothetical protein
MYRGGGLLLKIHFYSFDQKSTFCVFCLCLELASFSLSGVLASGRANSRLWVDAKRLCECELEKGDNVSCIAQDTKTGLQHFSARRFIASDLIALGVTVF